MIKQQIMQLLGLAKRAGEVTTGEGLVLQAIRKQTVHFVFIAKDAGPSSAKKIKDKCNSYKIPFNDALSKMEISQAIGQNRTVVAINQVGFSQKFHQLAEQINEGEWAYGQRTNLRTSQRTQNAK